MSRDGLDPGEDADLRRLHYLRRFGSMADEVAERVTTLRQRDRRLEIREPDETTVVSASAQKT
jgi:hypothetical protein